MYVRVVLTAAICQTVPLNFIIRSSSMFNESPNTILYVLHASRLHVIVLLLFIFRTSDCMKFSDCVYVCVGIDSRSDIPFSLSHTHTHSTALPHPLISAEHFYSNHKLNKCWLRFVQRQEPLFTTEIQKTCYEVKLRKIICFKLKKV